MADENVAKKIEPDSKRMQMIATAFIIICLVFLIWIFVRQYAAGLGTGLLGGAGYPTTGNGGPRAPNGSDGNASGGSTSGAGVEACLQSVGVAPGAVVFLHTNTCPHCANMKPIVAGLVSQGYDFVYAEYGDTAAAPVRECLTQYLSGYVPQFVCAYTGKEITGETSEQDLRTFADACRS